MFAVIYCLLSCQASNRDRTLFECFHSHVRRSSQVYTLLCDLWSVPRSEVQFADERLAGIKTAIKP